MNRDTVKEAILYLLFEGESPIGDGTGFTLLDIQEFLEANKLMQWKPPESYHDSWRKLKVLLNQMREEQLIEERHFDDKSEGRVDYSTENRGLRIIKSRVDSGDVSWKIPDRLQVEE